MTNTNVPVVCLQNVMMWAGGQSGILSPTKLADNLSPMIHARDLLAHRLIISSP